MTPPYNSFTVSGFTTFLYEAVVLDCIILRQLRVGLCMFKLCCITTHTAYLCLLSVWTTTTKEASQDHPLHSVCLFVCFLRILKDQDITYADTVRWVQPIPMCWSQVDRLDGDGRCFCRFLVWMSCVTDTCDFKQRLFWWPHFENRSQLDWIKQLWMLPYWCSHSSCVGMWFRDACKKKQNVQMWEMRQRYCRICKIDKKRSSLQIRVYCQYVSVSFGWMNKKAVTYSFIRKQFSDVVWWTLRAAANYYVHL